MGLCRSAEIGGFVAVGGGFGSLSLFTIGHSRVTDGPAVLEPGDLCPEFFDLSAGLRQGYPRVSAGSLRGQRLPVALLAQENVGIALSVVAALSRPLLQDAHGFHEADVMLRCVLASQAGDLADEGDRD